MIKYLERQLDSYFYNKRLQFEKPYIKRKNIEGVSFDFYISDQSAKLWYDIYCTDPVWNEMGFIKNNIIEKGDIVLECGSHHGCTAIVLSNWVGEKGLVYAFEPDPNNLKILSLNLKMNNINNVTIVPKATGNENKKIYFNINNNISMGSAVSIKQDKITFEVECVKLDNYLHLKPTFIKIDVQGFLGQTISGAIEILKLRPKLAIEFDSPDELQKYGYKVKDILGFLDLKDYKYWIQVYEEEMPIAIKNEDLPDFWKKNDIKKDIHIFGLPV